MDFGIALIPTGSRTLAGTVLGSPKYMAPEQVAGKPTDGRADIFSLGVVLYEMLTGSTPFNGDNLTAIMYKILNEEPAPPSTLNARVPKAFDSVVAKALAKRPEDRYQTAKEFARELYKYEVLVSPETDQAAAGGPDTTVMQKPLPAVSRRQAADSFGVKTEILLPPPPSMQPKPPPTPAPRTARRLALLALPLLALAAYLFLRPEQPSLAPALLARTPAEMPADNAEPGQPSARQAGADPAPAPVANASLSFAVTPWGEVFIDGRKAGITPPLTRLELPPGQHSIEIRNSAYAPYHVKVDLDSSETLKIKHKFK
jgi:serine/threonine-protein kinase